MSEGYCNKCNKYIKELNGLEKEEALNNNGSFVCSDCIQKEMLNENQDI